jgi:hypothetical protein
VIERRPIASCLAMTARMLSFYLVERAVGQGALPEFGTSSEHRRTQ